MNNEIYYDHRARVTVRLTLLVENSVVCCCQITSLFDVMSLILYLFFIEGLRNFHPYVYFVYSVFCFVRIEIMLAEWNIWSRFWKTLLSRIDYFRNWNFFDDLFFNKIPKTYRSCIESLRVKLSFSFDSSIYSEFSQINFRY